MLEQKQEVNRPVIDPDGFVEMEHETDVLVIGGGVAGVFASVKAHDAGAKVLLVAKGGVGTSGQTPFAKGVFSFDEKSSKISLDEFTKQVSYSALGTNNAVYTKQMAEHSKARVDELKAWGYFDQALCRDPLQKPIKEREIAMLERISITHLIKENGKIAGAAGFSLDTQTLHLFRAKSVILCTGAGGFKPNGFPICDLTHDGTVMAYNIGAKVTGKEWNDGHSGSAKNAAATFDGWHGMFEQIPSTTGVGIRHDLGVDLNYQAYENGGPVSMGPPHAGNRSTTKGGPYRPKGLIDQGPPPGSGDKEDRRGSPPPHGEGKLPPGMNMASVGGASAGLSIHKSEGLVPINDQCESTIKGLYAAGDALGSYMAGAIYTQIGSSMAGSSVQGAIAGEAAAKYATDTTLSTISKEKQKHIKEEILAPLNRKKGYSPAWVTQTLQGIMIPNFVLYIKKERMLQGALSYVEELRDHHLPMLKASDMHELRLAHETINMVISAEMKLKASLMRKESRCSHYRTDYPEMDKENWEAWINIYKGADGQMAFEKQPFGTWAT
ncbi:MAG: Succinate dehydrogenase flavoprotein subunit (EC [uncultured Sulfurovum sp.]|uniref:Succinate dehydrogenase flavoprotein subunit (EC) n=1 Tax=uncultured Sulfurovum sp. TaxID=269237 RepID=A0A6S6SFM3_9BACT|nr:MAG: Succinate dehydrogenase flavoprotein subunit (EC [uncultured Sulfurovum sp.]